MLNRWLTLGAIIGGFVVLLLFIASEPSFQAFATRTGLASVVPATAAGSLAARGIASLAAFALIMLLAALLGFLFDRSPRRATVEGETGRRRSYVTDDQPLPVDRPDAAPAASLSPLHAAPVDSPAMAAVPVTITPTPSTPATPVPALAESSSGNDVLLAAVQRLEAAVAALPASIKRAVSHPKTDPRLVAALEAIRTQLATMPTDPQLVETLQALAAGPAQSVPGGADALVARIDAHEQAVADRIDRLTLQIADMIAAQRDLITHIAALSAQSMVATPSVPSPISEPDAPEVRVPANPRLRDPAAAQRLANAIADLRRAADEALPNL